MSKSKRRSLSQQSNRRSSKDILDFSSDGNLSKRTTEWWLNLSDKSRRISILTNSQLHESYNILNRNSTVSDDQNSDWWKNLSGREIAPLPNKLSGIVKNVDKNISQSESDENENWRENVVPKKRLFYRQEQRSQKSRYSRAFNSDKEDRKLEVEKFQDQLEEENKVSKVTKGKTKRRKTRIFVKTIPGKRKYSDAFTVPNTEPEEFKQINEDKLIQKEDSVPENISFTKESNKKKSKEGLFKLSRKKKKYSEAFLNTSNDESIVKTPEKKLITEKNIIQANNSNSSNQMEKVNSNISTGNVNLIKENKSILSTTLQKTPPKELRIVIPKLNISSTLAKSSEIKDPMKQAPQNIKDHLETSREKDNIKDVISEIKDNVFEKKLRSNSKLLQDNNHDKKNEEVETKLSSHHLTKNQSEYNEEDESSIGEIGTRKSMFPRNKRSKRYSKSFLRSSNSKTLPFDSNKSYSEKESEETEEDQTKPNSSQQIQQGLFKVQNKRKNFSQAFVNVDAINDEDKENNKTDTVLPEDVTRQRKESLDNAKNKNMKYSQAFMELMSIHKPVTDERNTLESVVTESDINKSVDKENGNKESASIHSQFSSIPSIDISDDIKQPLFRPKARKSTYSSRSLIENKDQINVQSDEIPQHSEKEKTQEINAKRVSRQSTSLTESGISNFFDNSLISSTKLIINSNGESVKKKRERSHKRSSTLSSSSKKAEENNIQKKNIETEETTKHEIFVNTGQKINSISIIPEDSEDTENRIHVIEKNKVYTTENDIPKHYNSNESKKTTSIISKTRKSSVRTKGLNKKEVEDNRNADTEISIKNKSSEPRKTSTIDFENVENVPGRDITTEDNQNKIEKLITPVNKIENYNVDDKIFNESVNKKNSTIKRTKKSSVRNNENDGVEVNDNINTETERSTRNKSSGFVETKKTSVTVSEIMNESLEKESIKKKHSSINKKIKSSMRTNDKKLSQSESDGYYILNQNSTVSNDQNSDRWKNLSGSENAPLPNKLSGESANIHSQFSSIQSIDISDDIKHPLFRPKAHESTNALRYLIENEDQINDEVEVNDNINTETEISTRNKSSGFVETKKTSVTVSEIMNEPLEKESIKKKHSSIDKKIKSSMRTNDSNEKEVGETETEKPLKKKYSVSQGTKSTSITDSETSEDNLSFSRLKQLSMTTNKKPVQNKLSVFKETKNTSETGFKILEDTPGKQITRKKSSSFSRIRKSSVRSNENNVAEVDIRNKKTERQTKTKSSIVENIDVSGRNITINKNDNSDETEQLKKLTLQRPKQLLPLGLSKYDEHEERNLEAESDDQLKFRKKKKLMKHSNKIDKTPLDDELFYEDVIERTLNQSNVITINSSRSGRRSNQNVDNWLSKQNNQIENRNSEAFPVNFGPKSLFPRRHETTPEHIEEENANRQLLLIKALKTIPPNKEKKSPLVPAKKITDFFTRLRKDEELQPIPKKIDNIKKTPRPVCPARLIDGKPYYAKRKKKEKLWGFPDFYKFIQDKIRNKYGDDTINESENIMKYIENSVKAVLKSKKYMKGEVEMLKKELARHGIITTTYDFFMFCLDYLPYAYRNLVVPRTQAYTAEPSVPCDPNEIFKKIQF